MLKALPMAVRLSQARERMVLLMVSEAAAVLGEQLADDAQAIDLAMVLGTGWAPHRGGPLHYADHVGLSKVVETLVDLARRYGEHYEPCAELKRRAFEGSAFNEGRAP
jgi:3-hydroxyacyl-CoA dehydrogenase/enoyl-CoA hydratase/3-hydroxybutyryl-CoA epimerase